MPGVTLPPGFIRPDPEPHPDSSTLKKSLTRVLNDGSQRTYSSLKDYINHYISIGAVKDLDDLINNYSHLIGEIFFQWISTGQLGCLFAAKLAKKPRENRWLPIVLPDALNEKEKLGGLINATIDAAAGNHEAAVVILPNVITPEDIVKLVNTLCSDPSGRWYWTCDGINPDQSGECELIGLRWVLASDRSVNYVLGFANINSMPFTRLSPFTALFLRIRDEKRTPPDKEGNRVKVHLADLDSTFHPQELHDKVWDLTKKTRANFVEPDKDLRAKAKVTFAVPREIAAKLCPNRKVDVTKSDK